MDDIAAMIEICVDAHAPHLRLYHAQWTIVREWYEEQFDNYNVARYRQYKFWRSSNKIIEVSEILPHNYEKFRLLIIHDYSEYTREEER